ncbi:MAG: hypothetical protein GX431_08910 [Bacteroidales bacterium]|nr:hypothetical protein [Bacteroidales bacterium]
MKSKTVRITFAVTFLFALSCNEPRTIVTNIVYKDGSIRRKIEMKSSENKFNVSDLQVPFDSTWTIKDSLEISGDDFDSLWTNGFIISELLGKENSLRFRMEADSAANIAVSRLLPTFSDYTVRAIMPGRLTGTNGFVDSAGIILWPVKSDYFLTEQYVMKAKSRVINIWAWIVSGLFLVFVFSGVVIREKRKG